MMPVISPWIFYLIDIGSNIRFFSLITFITCFGILFLYYANEIIDRRGTEKISWNSNMNIATIFLIASLILLIIIPDEDTCYKMLIAEQITYERLGEGANLIQEIYEDILDLTVLE